MDARADECAGAAIHGLRPVLVIAPRAGSPTSIERWLRRFAVLALLGAPLLVGVAGGLLRAGASWPALRGSLLVSQAAGAHAMLMLAGFLGTAITIERAVAVRLGWAYAAPVLAVGSALSMTLGRFDLAAFLGIAAAAVLTAVHLVLLRRQRVPHIALLLVSALAWLTGNLVWAAGGGASAALPWWFLLPILTISAERLEMTRLTRRHGLALPGLVMVVAALLVGAGLSNWSAFGGVLYGVALFALACWFGAFDIARRTLFATGMARYMAVSLLAGYAWLALAGLAWVGVVLGCPSRDMALHALGLGFIVSMVMGHAPVILPAVARVKLRFGPWFYLPLAALHCSLVLRLFGGIGRPELRTLGAELNAGALALFALTLIGSAIAFQRRRGTN